MLAGELTYENSEIFRLPLWRRWDGIEENVAHLAQLSQIEAFMRIPSRRLVVNVAVLGAMVGLLSVAPTIARQRAGASMAKAAGEFLGSLTAEQRAKAAYADNGSEEWTRWNFIPASMFPRNGLAFKEMNQAQRQRAHDLMKASLSQKGYLTAASVMQLENVLCEIEGPSATAGAPPAPPAPPAAPPGAPTANGGFEPGRRRPARRRWSAGANAEGAVDEAAAAPEAVEATGAAAARRSFAIPELDHRRCSAIRWQPRARGAGGWKAITCRCASPWTTAGCSCSVRPQFLGSRPGPSPLRLRSTHGSACAGRAGGRRARARPRARSQDPKRRRRGRSAARIRVGHDSAVRSADAGRPAGRADDHG